MAFEGRTPAHILLSVGAAHVVSIVGVAIDDATHGHNGLELRRPHGCDLQRIDATPGNAPHAYRSVRPGLPGEPGNDLDTIGQFRNVVLIDHDSFGVSGAADIDPNEGDPIGREILTGFIVAPPQIIP